MSHPFVWRGALVQVADDVMALTPNVVAFQYNPSSVSRSIEPFQQQSAGGGGEAERPAPAVQPTEPTETIDITVELNASDDLGDTMTPRHAVAVAVGVADRIAAIEKMLHSTNGLFADLVDSTSALFGGGGSTASERPTIPIVFFVWGPGRMLPVRIASYSIEEQAFSQALFPIHASISLSLEVLVPSRFRCESGLAVELAKTSYKLHRTKQDALAAAHFASNVASGLVLLGDL